MDNETHKWNVYCEVTTPDKDSKSFDEGKTYENQCYVHLTAEADLEAVCRNHFGDRFIRIVFKEILD